MEVARKCLGVLLCALVLLFPINALAGDVYWGNNADTTTGEFPYSGAVLSEGIQYWCWFQFIIQDGPWMIPGDVHDFYATMTITEGWDGSGEEICFGEAEHRNTGHGSTQFTVNIALQDFDPGTYHVRVEGWIDHLDGEGFQLDVIAAYVFTVEEEQ